MMCRKKNAGFSLIELMIAIAIVGVLAAIAYPSYTDSLRQGRRNDGMAALLDAAQKLEVFRSRQASYTTNLAQANILDTSDEGFYGNLSVVPGDCGAIANCYTLEIEPTTLKNQDQDAVQGYRLTSTGVKTRLVGGTWIAGWR
ncbi:MAG: type IV pilin protein [Candidatus Thiodiazotropha sp.]